MKSIKCPSCFKHTVDGFTYCIGCGCKLPIPAPMTGAGVYSTTAERDAANLKGMLLPALLVVGVIVIVGWLASRGGSPKEEPKNDSVSYAYRICELMDKTGVASQPCSVNGGRNIDISLVASASEAKEICGSLAAAVKANGWSLEPHWRIRVISPYSNGNPIATCPL